ncbi:MAG: flavodoxin domain-containing protein [Comamonadaceae bacterium]|nr:flavodoxin domain-containing protein [Comamonadaceae bacterium]
MLLCTSTHGDGELPDNLAPFARRLQEARPDLSHLRYGVIALGDQTYQNTSCRAGKDMDALLASLGAHKVGERLEIDALHPAAAGRGCAELGAGVGGTAAGRPRDAREDQ